MDNVFKAWGIDTSKPIGLIFDIDELLFDNQQDIFDAYRSLLAARRIQIEASETFPGKDLFEIIGQLKQKYLIEDTIDDLVRERRTNYLNILNQTKSQSKPGVKELFNFLAGHKGQMGLRVAYATSSERAFTGLILKRVFELSDLKQFAANPDRFFYINDSEENAGTCWAAGMKKKPAPDVYVETIRKLQLAPSQCIAFEDSKSGFEAARAAGLNVFIVPSSWSRKDFSHLRSHEVSSGGVCKLETLKDVIPILEALRSLRENLQSLTE